MPQWYILRLLKEVFSKHILNWLLLQDFCWKDKPKNNLNVNPQWHKDNFETNLHYPSKDSLHWIIPF